jgi:hypothetical protein
VNGSGAAGFATDVRLGADVVAGEALELDGRAAAAKAEHQQPVEGGGGEREALEELVNRGETHFQQLEGASARLREQRGRVDPVAAEREEARHQGSLAHREILVGLWRGRGGRYTDSIKSARLKLADLRSSGYARSATINWDWY